MIIKSYTIIINHNNPHILGLFSLLVDIRTKRTENCTTTPTGRSDNVLCLCPVSGVYEHTIVATGSLDEAVAIWDARTEYALAPPALVHGKGGSALCIFRGAAGLVRSSIDRTIKL